MTREELDLEEALRLVEAAVQQAREATDAAAFAVALGNLQTAVRSVGRRGARRWRRA